MRGDGPTLIEAKCYRFLSHTTDDDDRTYRTRDEVQRHRELDPVPRFEERLVTLGVIDRPQIEALRKQIATLVNATTDEVEGEPYPEPGDLYGNVYAQSDDAWIGSIMVCRGHL